jgi:DNA adenine methylase
MTRPFIKCAGGKNKLVPLIKEMIPPRFGAYHEPFAGGAALFFAMQPKNAFLSDVNKELMNVYTVVRDSVSDLICYLKEYQNNREYFNNVRERNFREGNELRRAADYIYVNKVCFNGLYRVNKAGQFNVPFGKYANPTICDADNLHACSLALQGVKLCSVPYNIATSDMREGDFCYIDSPYEPVSSTSSFTAYQPGSFTTEDQLRLSKVALALKQRGVFVLLSNSSAPIIYQLYPKPDWTIREIHAKRSINSDGDKRGNVTELLIY